MKMINGGNTNGEEKDDDIIDVDDESMERKNAYLCLIPTKFTELQPSQVTPTCASIVSKSCSSSIHKPNKPTTINNKRNNSQMNQ
jgi:hypothetical protein